MPAIIPPNKALLVGALVIGGLWFWHRQASASTTGKRGGAAGGSKLAGVPRGYQNNVAPAGGYGGTGIYNAPNVGGASGGFLSDLVASIFGGGSASSARRTSSTDASGSAFGVPDALARAAVRAGDSYYGAGSAGNNDTAQQTFRRSELNEQYAGNETPQDSFRRSELTDQYANENSYGSGDQGVVSLAGSDDAQSLFRIAELNAQAQTYTPALQDAVVANPSPSVNFDPDVTYDPSSYTTGADDGGDLGDFL